MTNKAIEKLDKAWKIVTDKKISLISEDDHKLLFKANGSCDEYIVSYSDELGWQCDCPDFEYRAGTCKHIYSAILYLANLRFTGFSVIPGV